MDRVSILAAGRRIGELFRDGGKEPTETEALELVQIGLHLAEGFLLDFNKIANSLERLANYAELEHWRKEDKQ